MASHVPALNLSLFQSGEKGENNPSCLMRLRSQFREKIQVKQRSQQLPRLESANMLLGIHDVWKKVNLYLKIMKLGLGCSSVIEHLHKALGSIPRTEKLSKKVNKNQESLNIPHNIL
jgi:hypothetical protein